MNREYWFVVLAGIFSGLIIFGGKVLANLGLSLYEIIMLPMILATLILLPFVIFKEKYRIKISMLKLYIFFGFISFILAILEFAPILLGVPVAIIVLMLYTQPLWTAILSRLFLNERLTKYKILAIFLVISGVIVMVNPFTLQSIGNLLGVFLALAGGIALSCWVICGRLAGIKKYNPLSTQFGYILFTLIFLFASYPLVKWLINDKTISGLSFNLPANIWIYILLFAVFANILPHVLYFIGAKKVQASSAGVILLLEPITATILAMIFLNQQLTLNIVIGGFLILISNYLIAKEEQTLSQKL